MDKQDSGCNFIGVFGLKIKKYITHLWCSSVVVVTLHLHILCPRVACLGEYGVYSIYNKIMLQIFILVKLGAFARASCILN